LKPRAGESADGVKAESGARRKRRGRLPAHGQKSVRGLLVRKSSIDGLGCFAEASFQKGALIAEYVGERINHLEAMRRMKDRGRSRVSEVGEDCYIDGSVGGNVTQFINHACEPNSDVLIEEGRMFIIALRDLAPGEEITVDYLNSFDEDDSICRCRSAACRRGANQKAA
jgi:SET domain-containing protein